MLIDRVRQLLPPKYREFAKFLVVGGTAWVVDMGLFTVLSHTVLERKVLTAKVVSVLVATIVSYVLNREWSFSSRGGRSMSHEAMYFFVINGMGMAINLIPLWLSHYVIGINVGNGYERITVSVADWIAANVIGTIVAMVFRYWAYRRFVFPKALDEMTADDRARNGKWRGSRVSPSQPAVDDAALDQIPPDQ